MPPVLSHLPARAWLLALAIPLLGGMATITTVRAAMEPPYEELPITGPERQREATRVLDLSGVRWRYEGRGQVLAVEAGRRAEAAGILERAGVRAAVPRRPRAAAAPSSAESEAARALERDVNGLLGRTIGAERAFVIATVTLDRDRVAAQRLRFGPRGPALARAADGSRWSGAIRGGRVWRSTAWAADRSLTRTRFATGRRARVALALAVDRRLPRRTVRELRRTVRAAAGLGRRDRLAVSRLPMARRPQAAEGAGWRGSHEAQLALAYAPAALLAMAIVLFLLEIRRALAAARRLRGASTAAPAAAAASRR